MVVTETEMRTKAARSAFISRLIRATSEHTVPVPAPTTWTDLKDDDVIAVPGPITETGLTAGVRAGYPFSAVQWWAWKVTLIGKSGFSLIQRHFMYLHRQIARIRIGDREAIAYRLGNNLSSQNYRIVDVKNQKVYHAMSIANVLEVLQVTLCSNEELSLYLHVTDPAARRLLESRLKGKTL